MHYKATILALAGAALAQGDSPSLCDKYTQALTMDNTAANQKTVLTLIVNTAVIGNYSNMSKTAVDGILTPGMFQGQQVSLAKYFDGSMPVANRGGMATQVNFLDGGGAAPLMQNMAATDDTSNQARLLNHLYSYFGLLLGCSQVGMDGFPGYDGQNSQYDVHKFMKISAPEFGYFVTQVGASAKSFGVSEEDVNTVANSLMTTFGYRCSPAADVGGAGPMLQSICTGDGCPTDPNPMCAAYDMGSMGAGGSSGGSEGSMTSSGAAGSMTMSASMGAGGEDMGGMGATPTTEGGMPAQTSNAAAMAHMEPYLAAMCGALAFL